MVFERGDNFITSSTSKYFRQGIYFQDPDDALNLLLSVEKGKKRACYLSERGATWEDTWSTRICS